MKNPITKNIQNITLLPTATIINMKVCEDGCLLKFHAKAFE